MGCRAMSFRVEKRVSPEEEGLTARILGAAVTVHRILGPGFVESVYRHSLERELPKCGLRFQSEKRIEVLYDGVVVGEHRLDLLVESKVVVELKAATQIVPAHMLRCAPTSAPSDSGSGSF